MESRGFKKILGYIFVQGINQLRGVTAFTYLFGGPPAAKGYFLEKNTPWSPKKLFYKASSKVFEDFQETFFKKFLESGLGRRPIWHKKVNAVALSVAQRPLHMRRTEGDVLYSHFSRIKSEQNDGTCV